MPALLKVLLLLALLPAASAAAAEPPAAPRAEAAPTKAKVAPQEIEFYAAQQYLLRKEGVAVLSGSAWVSCRGMLLEAEHIVVWQKERQAYAQGAVRLTERGGRLLADEIFYDFSTDRGRATGVRLEAGRIEEVPGKAAGPAELPKPAGGDAAVFGGGSPAKWYVSAPEIRRAGPGRWQVLKPVVSSCDFGEPHWRFQASSADYYPGQRVQSFNNVLYLGPVPVFYFPYMARDLAHDYPWTAWQLGHSSEWGYYGLSKWGVGLPSDPGWVIQPTHLLFDADWREHRGWAYGGELRYDMLPHGGGFLDGYFLREDLITADQDRQRAADAVVRRQEMFADLRASGAPKVIGRPKRLFEENLLFAERRARDGSRAPDLAPDRYEEESRDRIVWVHRQDLFPVKNDLHEEPVYALDFTAELFDGSDRDFQREYFRDEYRYAPPPMTYAMLRHQGDAGSAALVVQPRVNPFSSETEYLPEFRYHVPAQPLPAGLFLASGGDAGYLRRRFDEDSGFEDFEAGRGHVRLVANRPVALGPVSFNPYVGTDQAWYSQSRQDRDLGRGALVYGADSSVRFYGVYAAESDALNVHGLRHVVEPRLFYRGVSEPTGDPVEVYDFDATDDLAKTDVAGAGLFQKLQTKRRGPDGKERVADLAGLDLSASGFIDPDEADRLNDRDRLLPFKALAFLSPVDYLKLWGSAEIDAHGVGLARTVEGLHLAWPERFTAELTYTTIAAEPERDIHGSRYLAGRLETVISDRWRLGAASAYEFAHTNEQLGPRGVGDSRISLIRDLHCWVLSLDYSISRINDGRRNNSVGLTLSATGVPRNLVRGSDQLLLESPEYGREPWLFRPAEPRGELRVVPPEEPPAPAGK